MSLTTAEDVCRTDYKEIPLAQCVAGANADPDYLHEVALACTTRYPQGVSAQTQCKMYCWGRRDGEEPANACVGRASVWIDGHLRRESTQSHTQAAFVVLALVLAAVAVWFWRIRKPR
ncbi:MAG: hypothetical protein JSR54_19025 [Proteobacteria bacterium]|nr:hypothetical protein [Pseudomonadota bacterium]